MEFYSSIKKEWNNAISSNMDGPVSQRKTNIIWYHSYVESLKKKYNELIYKTEIDL